MYPAIFSLCNNFYEPEESSHHFSEASSSPCSGLNTPLEQAFFHPRTVGARTRLDWTPRHLFTASILPRVWCRMAVLYADWASHVPELRSLDTEDKVALMSARATQCVCMWHAGVTLRRRSRDEVVLSGGSYFPRDEGAQKALAGGENEAVLSFLRSVYNPVFEEMLHAGADMGVSEEEVAILKVLTLCVPVPALSAQGRRVIRDAQARYQAALVEVLSTKGVMGGGSSPVRLYTIQRLSTQMAWLSTIERVAQEACNHLSLMTLFNIAEMRGTFPYEIHVRRNT